MSGDPLYSAWRTLLTGAGLLQPRQVDRVEVLFEDARPAAVEAPWGVYEDIITAYREADRGLGKHFLTLTIERIGAAAPAELEETPQARTNAEEARRRRARLLRPPADQQRTHRGDL